MIIDTRLAVDPQNILKDVLRALEEDIGSGDVSAALLPSDAVAEAEIISREPMLLCGQPWVNAVFNQLDSSITIKWLFKEGTWLSKSETLAQIKGPASALLTAERSALNFLQTLSATATQTYHYLQRLKGFETKLLDTRKTLPGLRLAQKYAVACAGAVNHRMGLYDAYLIKENHIKACGSITKAIKKARELNPKLMIEVEVESLVELEEALAAKPDRIMLDNFSKEMIQTAVEINQTFHCQLEASGGINMDSLAEIAETGINFISIGAITKSIQAIDLSLLIRDVKCIQK